MRKRSSIVARGLAVAVLLFLSLYPLAAHADLPLYVHPEDRAAGNHHEAAVKLARALLTVVRPVTIQQVRVDGVDGHEVAGIVLSAAKFHHVLDSEGFLAEVRTLIADTFAHSSVEEVDLWAVVPVPVPKGAIVSGDLAVPTTRTVFSCSVRRDYLARLAQVLRDPSDVYWEPAFVKRLSASPSSSPQGSSQ